MAKAPSYTKIDYSLRPAKVVERKMMVDLLRRLDRSSSLRHYRYVGFGSPYFADFDLVHRALGISDLVSIERESDDEVRFRFNAPYAAVELRFGDSSEVLPVLDWSQQRAIVWLDYDERLDEAKLADVAYLVANLASGSALAVTVNAHPSSDIDTRLEVARRELGGNLLPRKYSDEDLGGWGTADAYRTILHETIKSALTSRNTGKSKSAMMHYRQLFNFNYRDGARMLTVGGVLFDTGQDGHINQCKFDDFEFFRDGDEAFLIALPKLTSKEMRYIDTKLPSAPLPSLADAGIPISDAEKYAVLYRYFPKFVDIQP